ncbi:unnamed protein product [Symbiodinium sp. KB8]|nr:unnamed protein product [Symbiodinium sp. KB8]
MSTPVPPSVSPFAQRSADSEQESKRSASAFACKDRSCHTHSGRQHVHIPEHCSVRGASHDIIVYQPSRRLSAVGSAYTRTLTSNKHISYDIWIKCRYNHALWCGGGEVAKLAACESTADDPLTVSVDSATAEEDKKTLYRQRDQCQSVHGRKQAKDIRQGTQILQVLTLCWTKPSDLVNKTPYVKVFPYCNRRGSKSSKLRVDNIIKLESDYSAKMAELRAELRQARQTEDRLHDDRNYWRAAAEEFPQDDSQDHDEEQEEEEESVPPSESPTNIGPGGPGGSDDYDDSLARERGCHGGDPSGPPPDDPDNIGDTDVTEVKITRREADKVTVPPFPKVTHLDSWMSHCIANVLSACADPNHEEWVSWLQPAFRPDPDIDRMIESGRIKFKSIDAKLGVAVTSLLKSAGDTASDLYLDVNRKANRYVRTESKLIKGRQIIAMKCERIRTRDRMDMIVSLDYLIKLQHQGDQKMSTFNQTWLQVIDRRSYEEEKGIRGRKPNLLNGDKCPYSHSKKTPERGRGKPQAKAKAKADAKGRDALVALQQAITTNDLVGGDRHVYARVPRSNHIRQIIFYDGEDELMERDLSPDKNKKVKTFEKITCMVPPTWIRRSKIKFLMDDGCGDDLISKHKVRKHGLETLVSQEAVSFQFQTARGVTNTDLISNFQTESFTEPINAYVLDDTPSADLQIHLTKKEIENVLQRMIERLKSKEKEHLFVKRKLEAEAKTLAHLCTHRYRDPYCEHFRTECGAFKRELKSWGDLVTFDFLDMRKTADMGVGDDDEAREVLVVRDIATRATVAIPTESRHTDEVVDALARFIGRRKVKLAYSDVAPEFDAAMAQLRIPIDHSLPGQPKDNSLAERTNQKVINTVTCRTTSAILACCSELRYSQPQHCEDVE